MMWLQVVLLAHLLLLIRLGLNWLLSDFQKKPTPILFSELLQHLSDCYQNIDDSYNCAISKQKTITKVVSKYFGVSASKQFDICTSSVFMLGKDVNQMALLLRMCYDNAMLTEDSVGYMEISYKFSMYAFKPAIAVSVVCAQLFCLLQIAQFAFSCFSNNNVTPFQVPKKGLNTKIIRQPQKPLRLKQREYNLFKPNSKDEIENHLKTISQINKLLVEEDKQKADIKSLKSSSAVKRFTFGETLLPSNSIWSLQAPKKLTTIKSETLKVKNDKEILKVKNDKENVKVTKVKNSKFSSGSKMSSDQIKANFKKKVLALKNQNKKVKS